MKDSLGDRIKNKYEGITRYFLMGRSYTIIRLDIVAAHTFCKGLEKPFDDDFISDMNETTKYICSKIMGCKVGYTQSDEITLILTDFDKIESEAWFGNNLQKLCSVSASMATSKFNELRFKRWYNNLSKRKIQSNEHSDDRYKEIKNIYFDSRVFQVPNRSEVFNVLLWRQNDAVRNSISMVAQSMYSQKELHGKNTDQMQELAFLKGVNWNDLEAGKKRGRLFTKVTYVNGVNLRNIPFSEIPLGATVRNKWEPVETQIRFSADKFYDLKGLIPNND